VHDSLLPEYRGFAPLNWSIINDEPKTGVSLFRISERMDGGEILLQREVPIGHSDSAPDVYRRVCDATVRVVLDGYRLLDEGNGSPVAQDYSKGSFTCSRTPRDGRIEWVHTTRQIYNLIRALTFPYPGAYTYYQGQRLIVLAAEEAVQSPPYRGRLPGRVVRIAPGHGADVLTGDGVITLKHVSTDGHSIQPAEEIIRSVKTSLGLSLEDLEQRVMELERRLEALKVDAHH
jgi:methionyl-tRNA formyltransferase